MRSFLRAKRAARDENVRAKRADFFIWKWVSKIQFYCDFHNATKFRLIQIKQNFSRLTSDYYQSGQKSNNFFSDHCTVCRNEIKMMTFLMSNYRLKRNVFPNTILYILYKLQCTKLSEFIFQYPQFLSANTLFSWKKWIDISIGKDSAKQSGDDISRYVFLLFIFALGASNFKLHAGRSYVVFLYLFARWCNSTSG